MASMTVAAGIVAGFRDYVVRRGGDVASLLTHAGIDRATLDDPDARVPAQAYKLLIRQAQRALDDPALALRWGADVDMADVSIVGLIMNASETMGEAFAQMQRFGRLVMETGGAATRYEVMVKDGGVWMVDRFPDAMDFPEMIEVTFARLVCGPRRFLPQPHVLEIHFTQPAPPHRDALREVFKCPVRFEAEWNAMRIHPETPSWRVSQHPRYVFGVLTDHADKLLARLDADRAVRAQVETVLLPMLHTGRAGADSVASQLGMSRQTLYRRLKDEGATFGEVMDDLRRRMALDYLGARRVSVNEAAYLVGFSDPAAFSRAFKRWTGESPSAVRTARARP